jgi:hypothetical protein
MWILNKDSMVEFGAGAWGILGTSGSTEMMESLVKH